MKLPQQLLSSKFFVFRELDELLGAVGEAIGRDEIEDMRRLSSLELPPITSRETLGAMLGTNPGIIWSFEHRTRRHYRNFELHSGTKVRRIYAPKIGLKIFQKWMSVHLQGRFAAPDHVFGFVPGKSHIDAASRHCGAEWVFSVDLKDFFPSTSRRLIASALLRLGYGSRSAELISALCCRDGVLAQGAPSSPVLSNIVFSEVDASLLAIAQAFGIRMTRYADDIVFSGVGDMPEDLPRIVGELIEGTAWLLAPEKSRYAKLPSRLKVHGLLVHRGVVRLTKGYRNRLRAYKHLQTEGKIDPGDFSRISGHLKFSQQVDGRAGRPEDPSRDRSALPT